MGAADPEGGAHEGLRRVNGYDRGELVVDAAAPRETGHLHDAVGLSPRTRLGIGDRGLRMSRLIGGTE